MNTEKLYDKCVKKKKKKKSVCSNKVKAFPWYPASSYNSIDVIFTWVSRKFICKLLFLIQEAKLSFLPGSGWGTVRAYFLVINFRRKKMAGLNNAVAVEKLVELVRQNAMYDRNLTEHQDHVLLISQRENVTEEFYDLTSQMNVFFSLLCMSFFNTKRSRHRIWSFFFLSDFLWIVQRHLYKQRNHPQIS